MKDQLIGAFSLACISMVLCSCRAASVVIEVQGGKGVQKDPYRILFPDRPSDKLVVQLPGLVFGQRYFVHALSSGEVVVDIKASCGCVQATAYRLPGDQRQHISIRIKAVTPHTFARSLFLHRTSQLSTEVELRASVAESNVPSLGKHIILNSRRAEAKSVSLAYHRSEKVNLPPPVSTNPLIEVKVTEIRDDNVVYSLATNQRVGRVTTCCKVITALRGAAGVWRTAG
jgi:hypothetical protein